MTTSVQSVKLRRKMRKLTKENSRRKMIRKLVCSSQTWALFMMCLWIRVEPMRVHRLILRWLEFRLHVRLRGLSGQCASSLLIYFTRLIRPRSSSKRSSSPSRTDLRVEAPTSTTIRVIGLSSKKWKSTGLSIRIVSCRRNVAMRRRRQRWISGLTQERGWKQKSCERRSSRM